MKNLAMRAAGGLAVGLHRLLDGSRSASVGILTYHRVAPEPPGLPRPLHNVTPQRFRQQLSGLLRAGFRIVPLGRLLEARAGARSLPERTLVVTFDDGYGALHRHAWPILSELGVPATLFLATAYLDRGEAFPFDAWGTVHGARAPADAFQPLTTAQCRELLASGLFELGSHTHTHADFRGRPEAFAPDLHRSLAILRERFALERVPFAFPYGSRHRGFADDELAVIVRRAGSTCALSTEPAVVDPLGDPFRWGRFNVFPWDTAATLAAKLRGWYSWAPRIWQQAGRGRGRLASGSPA